MKKRFSLESVCGAILFVYVFAVIIGQYMLSFTSVIVKSFLVVLIFVAAGVWLLIRRGGVWVHRRFVPGGPPSGKELAYWFAVTAVFSLAVLAAYYIAFFPGTYGGDMDTQLGEVASGVYDDWHPFIHTLLYYTIPLKVFGAVEIIVPLQILWFSLALAYLTMTLRKNRAPRWLCAAEVLYVVLAPATGNALVCPMKDCAMTTFAMVFMAHYVNIICTKGSWLEKKRNIFAAGLFFVLTLLVRHNAILLVGPMLFIAAIYIWNKRKQLISLILCICVIYAAIKGPLYSAYNVQKASNRTTEVVGLCMSVMGNVAAYWPEALPPEVQEFLYSVTPKEVWETTYFTGSFNHVKWLAETNWDPIEEAGAFQVMKYTVETIRSAPGLCLQAFLKVTGMVWQIDGSRIWGISADPDVSKSEITLPPELQMYCYNLLQAWGELVRTTVLNNIFWFVGLLDMLLVTFALTGIRNSKDIVRALHAVPVLCYNFGTALLLTGYDWRFFYYTMTLFFPLLFMMVQREGQTPEDIGTEPDGGGQGLERKQKRICGNT